MGGHLGSPSKTTLNRLGDDVDYDSNRFRGIIIAGDRKVDNGWVRIAVDESDYGNIHPIRLGHRNRFVVRIDNKKCSRKAFKIKQTLEISVHAGHLPLNCCPLFTRKSIQTAVLLHTKIFLVLGQTGGNGLKIRQGTPHPAVNAKRGIGGGGHFPDGFLGLSLCSDQENGFSASHYFFYGVARLFQKVVGLF